MNKNRQYYLCDEITEGGGGGGGAPAAPAAGAPAAPAGGTPAPAAGAKPAAGANPWPENWRQAMAGEDPKAIKQIERYSSPKEVWNKAMSFHQRMSSGELRSALAADATPEAVAQWRIENGVPADPSGYDLSGMKIPDEDKDIVAGFTAAMHAANANPAEVRAGLEWHYKEAERIEEADAARDKLVGEKTEDALRAEWGNEYKVNMNIVNSLINSAPASVRDEFMHGRLANGEPIMANAEVIKWLNGIARESNPVTTVMPNVSGDFAGALDTEIANIEKVMRTNRVEYNKDEKMQSRLRDLYEAKGKMQARAA